MKMLKVLSSVTLSAMFLVGCGATEEPVSEDTLIEYNESEDIETENAKDVEM